MAKSGAIALTVRKSIPVSQIKLDLENPRYYEAQMELDIDKWTDKKLEEHIVSEDISDILGSIKMRGVTDPVWIHEIKNDEYVMVEGSRRLVVLRQLAGEKPPTGVSYDTVISNVYPKDTDPKIINVQKVILQTGKKKWGAFNEAKAIYDLIHKDRYSPEEVAKYWKRSLGSIHNELDNFKYYSEFTSYIKNSKLAVQNPRHYSYFQKTSADVRQRFFGTKKQREQFYNLIIPNRLGITKIPNVSLKGGLIKAFNKFAKNEIILRKFMQSPRMTADEALLEYQGGNVQDEFPWTRKLKDVVSGMNRLSKSDVDKIKKDKTIFSYIKKIYFSSKGLVEKK